MLNGNASSLKGFDIVCLGTVKWLVVRSVAEHTMMRLAKKNRVLFVEPFHSFSTLVRVARWQKRGWQTNWGVRKVEENLWVYSPPPIGAPGTSRLRWPAVVNGWILNHLLTRVIRELGFHNPLIWTFLYDSAPVVRRLKPRLSIYECIDLDEGLANSDHQRRLVHEREQALCREADIVFGVTEGLANSRRAFNPNTFEVNCAADTEYFGRALHDTTEVPSDLVCLSKPIVGYMGGVDPWKMDIELLQTIARTHPSWSIALVGYVWFGFDPTPLQAFPNIHVLGAKHYEDFPGYLKGMDVCIMPFPLNEITRNGDALKCYEYLAAGKPVVSTPVPAAQRFPGIVKIASTPEAFVSAIEESLREDASAVDRRLAAVQSHSWEHRIEQKSRLIHERLRETRDKTRL